MKCLKKLREEKYPSLECEVVFDALKIPSGCQKVTLSFPALESLNGWKVSFLKQVSFPKKILCEDLGVVLVQWAKHRQLKPEVLA